MGIGNRFSDSPVYIAIGRFLQGQVASHNFEPRVHISVSIAACILGLGGIAVCIAFISIFMSFPPPYEQNVHPVEKVTPQEAVDSDESCEDVTEYGESGLLLSNSVFASIYIRTPMLPDEIMRKMRNMSCQHILSTDEVVYSNWLGVVSRTGNSKTLCSLPGDADETKASIYAVRSFSWGDICEILLARMKQAYNALRVQFPSANSPDLVEGMCSLDQREYMTFAFFYAWPLNPERPLVMDVFEDKYGTSEVPSGFGDLLVDCITGHVKGYAITDECALGEAYAVFDQPSLAADVLAIYDARAFFERVYTMGKEQIYAFIPGRARSVEHYLEVEFPTAAESIAVAVEVYAESKAFKIRCITYDYPGFQSHAAYLWPILSLSLTATMFVIRIAYKVTAASCHRCGLIPKVKVERGASDHGEPSVTESNSCASIEGGDQLSKSPSGHNANDGDNVAVDVMELREQIALLRMQIAESKSATFKALSAAIGIEPREANALSTSLRISPFADPIRTRRVSI